jgi:hypothetical protein
MSRIRSVSTRGRNSASSGGRSAPGASSWAARTCRSGAASKVNRNASGAVSATDMPCGTMASSAG